MNKLFFGLVIMINMEYLSAKILSSPLKFDYKNHNELDFILKHIDDKNIKDNQVTSSYIKFDQNQDDENENLKYISPSFISIDPKSKLNNDQSDIIIRFARSGTFDFDPVKKFHFLPLNIQQLLILCGDFNNIDPGDIVLIQLCNYITTQLNEENKNY